MHTRQVSITTDFLVIGGGIIGLTVALGMKKRYPSSKVTLIEKEASCGVHASGRNSGVLHAGFYYSPDSLKAKFTREGNVRLTSYCEDKEIPLNRGGKLVVARDASDLPALDELVKRGRANGIELHQLNEQEAKEIEPRVKTHQKALFSPTTSTVDPTRVLQAMEADATDTGVQIHRGAAFVRKIGRKVETTECHYAPGYVINAAGLYADRIARKFGFSQRYRVLPFKGLYLYSDEIPGALRTNVYPVPDLRNPFLGVHFTVTHEGRIKIGPTAIPALWLEQYGGLSKFSLSEFLEITWRGLSLLSLAGFEFRRLAIDELMKRSRKRMVWLASQLVDGVQLEHYSKWGIPGIRAQLFDTRKRRLEMDFVLEGDEHSMHVLNAVSPGFTCALPFSEYICQRIEEVVH